MIFLIPAMIGAFANAWMLLWGVAAAIPIALHLWSRRRYREMSWAAMEFLLAAARKNARRIRIEQLLLLLIRVLIVSMLAAALAEPFLATRGNLDGSTAAAGTTHHLIVLDASYSMDARQGDRSLFSLAQDRARQLVQQAVQGDAFTVVLLADPPEIVIGQPTFDRSVVVEEIDGASLTDQAARVGALVEPLESLIQRVTREYPRILHHEIAIFTDLTRATWDDAADTAMQTEWQRLGALADIEIVELGEANRENLAVTRWELQSSLVTTGNTVVVEGEVRNHGTQDRNGLRVDFLVDGQLQDQNRVDVRAGGSGSVAFRCRFEQAGEHALKVVLQADPLPVDNQRWLSVPVVDRLRVLCVEGRAGEADFLRLALEPARDDQTPVETQVADESILLEEGLNRFDAIFLCNVAKFNREERAVLSRYLHNGGGLVFFLGDQVEADQYNEILGEDGDESILPARLEPAVSAPDVAINPLDYQHPLVSAFRGQERAGLLSTPIWRYFPLRPMQRGNEPARVALATDRGDPLVVDAMVGEGRCLLFATSVSTQSMDRSVSPPTPWTALPTWPSFVPLIQESLVVVGEGRGRNRNVNVGESLHYPAPSLDPDAMINLAGPVDPQGRFPDRERLRVVVEKGQAEWSSTALRQSGLYQATVRSDLSWKRWFAANIETQESDLTRLERTQLAIPFPAAPREDARLQEENDLSGRRPIFQSLLVGLLGLLLVESFFASSLARKHRGLAR
ncbi:MAG: hypothetical protein RIS70_2489 [Planctomycetota bacterium]